MAQFLVVRPLRTTIIYVTTISTNTEAIRAAERTSTIGSAAGQEHTDATLNAAARPSADE